MNIQNAKTKELVEFFNANCEKFSIKPVKKFADRATAEKRVTALVDMMSEEATDDAIVDVVDGFTHCPHCEIHLDNGYDSHEAQKAEERELNGMYEYNCLACGHEFGPRIAQKKERGNNHAARAAAIKESWKNAEVAAKRSQRHGVQVSSKNGVEEFRSVRSAFVTLGLPLNVHIKFRMELKEAGSIKDAYGYDWDLIEL